MALAVGGGAGGGEGVVPGAVGRGGRPLGRVEGLYSKQFSFFFCTINDCFKIKSSDRCFASHRFFLLEKHRCSVFFVKKLSESNTI